MTMAFGGDAKNYTVIDNEFHGGGGIDLEDVQYSLIADNRIYDNGKLCVATNSIARNNTAGIAMISAVRSWLLTGAKNPVQFTNNNVTTLRINELADVKNNNIGSITIFNINAENSSITSNNITGTVDISRATNITFSNNIVNNYANYTINVTTANNSITNNYLVASSLAGSDTIISENNNIISNNTPLAGNTYNITDSTYSNYFNNDGVLITSVIGNYSKLYLQGDFYNKNFTFRNTKINLIGDNATLYNSTITSADNSITTMTNSRINNKNNNNNTIILESDNNRIINVTIKHDTDRTSTEILVKGLLNTIENNKIIVNSSNNITAISVLSADNVINNNKINLNTIATANAVIIKSDKITSNQLTNNNIEIKSDKSHGITFENSNTSIITNTINITANEGYLIETYFNSNVTLNINITSNTLNANGNNIKGITVEGKNIIIRSNTINLKCKNASQNNTAILLRNSDNITIAWGNNITAVNASGLILTNTNNTKGEYQKKLVYR